MKPLLKFQQVTFEGLGYPNLIVLKKLIILNLFLNQRI